MTAAVPGPAAQGAHASAPVAAHPAAPSDASADALIAALFDAALEQALGGIDAARLPAEAAPLLTPAALPVAIDAMRDRAPDDEASAAPPGTPTADAWLAIAAWRQDGVPAAVPVSVPAAVPALAVPGTPRSPEVADSALAVDRPAVDAAAAPGPANLHVDAATARVARDAQLLEQRPAEAGPTSMSTDVAKPATAAPAAPAVHDDKRATRPQDAAMPPAMAPSAASWAAAPGAPANAAPIDAAAFAPALAEQVVRLVHLKMDRVELAVHPAELGPVELKVTMTGADANVVVIAVHPEARAALEQSLPDLRSLLQGAGIALGEASVRDGGDRRDAPQAPSPSTRDPARAEADEAAPIAVIRRRGLVDLYA